jgi:hypothetical protein
VVLVPNRSVEALPQEKSQPKKIYLGENGRKELKRFRWDALEGGRTEYGIAYRVGSNKSGSSNSRTDPDRVQHKHVGSKGATHKCLITGQQSNDPKGSTLDTLGALFVAAV